MGKALDVICSDCATRFTIHDGPGMIAMPLRCDACGKEWWWHFGPGGPIGDSPDSPPCECGGTFTSEALARCPNCRSTNYERDPSGEEILYD